ncbi:MAG: hypothetical protein MI861_09010, partial [Pirellulales bacterium]|nr:hypothetical protein [Pirellulales bacterium]
MGTLIFPLGFAAAIGAVGYYWRYAWLKDQVRRRLDTPFDQEASPSIERPFARRHWILPWLAGALLTGGLIWLAGGPWNV